MKPESKKNCVREETDAPQFSRRFLILRLGNISVGVNSAYACQTSIIPSDAQEVKSFGTMRSWWFSSIRNPLGGLVPVRNCRKSGTFDVRCPPRHRMSGFTLDVRCFIALSSD